MGLTVADSLTAFFGFFLYIFPCEKNTQKQHANRQQLSVGVAGS